MARFTQFPLMITRLTIIYEIISPGALPAAAYTFNTVPICDPSGPNPHGLV